MNTRDAVALLADAVPRRAGTWADLGAGDGTFTRALVELLGPEALIYAVDRDGDAIASLNDWAARAAPNVVPLLVDFTVSVERPARGAEPLDGLLLANSLHYVPDAEGVLWRLAGMVRPGGRVVVIEYDRRAPTPWVPFPVSPARLAELAARAGLSEPVVTATRRSRYGGILYVATADRTA